MEQMEKQGTTGIFIWNRGYERALSSDITGYLKKQE